jgi:hypothetical protein
MDTANNNLLLGFAGNACAGKDTTNLIIQHALITKWGKRNFKSITPQKFFYTNKNNKIVPSDNPSDTFVIYYSCHIPDKDVTLNMFNVPLANEVKRIYVEDANFKGVQVSFEDLLTNPTAKKQHRQGLIDIGDGYREKYAADLWLNKLDDIVSMLAEKFQQANKFNVFSVPDIRYINEPLYIEQQYQHIMPVLTSKINCSLKTRLARMTQEQALFYLKKQKNNASERNVKRIAADFELNNDGTISDLTEQIHQDIMPCINMLVEHYQV